MRATWSGRRRTIASAQSSRCCSCRAGESPRRSGSVGDYLDLDAGVAIVRRTGIYVHKVGMVLGPTKNAGASGTHHLSAGVVELLRARRKAQAAERLACREAWPTHTYEGQTVSLVFTNERGGLVNRQAAAKSVTRAATRAGIDPKGIATHTGRAVTVLYAEAGLDISDIARYVGHKGEAPTAGYVRSLGERPKATAAMAASMLDPAAARRVPT